MSLRDQIAADLTTIFSTNDFGETVERWPHGSRGASHPVVAVWEAEESPTRDFTMESQRIEYDGTLHVRTEVNGKAIDYHDDDVWVIDGECYQTLTVTKDVEGVRIVRVQAADAISRSRHSRGGLL